MNPSTLRRSIHLVLLAVALTAYSSGQEDPQLCRGQTVYVSVYSNILTGPRAIQFGLESTLIIRNTDISNPLSVSTADFYDTEGRLVRRFVETPLLLQPLETKYIHIPSAKTSAGLGANFIVRWSAEREINAPIIECLMIGTRSGQGISFISTGKVIQEHSR